MDPNFARPHLFLAGLYEQQGRFEEAISEYEKHAANIGVPADDIGKAWGAVRQAYKTGGPKSYWQALLELAKKGAEARPESAPPLFVFAVLSAQAGDKDRAFEYLERSFQQREVDILRLNEPLLIPLHSDPRYNDLIRRIGLPQ